MNPKGWLAEQFTAKAGSWMGYVPEFMLDKGLDAMLPESADPMLEALDKQDLFNLGEIMGPAVLGSSGGSKGAGGFASVMAGMSREERGALFDSLADTPQENIEAVAKLLPGGMAGAQEGAEANNMKDTMADLSRWTKELSPEKREAVRGFIASDGFSEMINKGSELAENASEAVSETKASVTSFDGKADMAATIGGGLLGGMLGSKILGNVIGQIPVVGRFLGPLTGIIGFAIGAIGGAVLGDKFMNWMTGGSEEKPEKSAAEEMEEKEKAAAEKTDEAGPTDEKLKKNGGLTNEQNAAAKGEAAQKPETAPENTAGPAAEEQSQGLFGSKMGSLIPNAP